MAATKLQRNWTAVTFATSPVTKVTKVSIDMGGKLMPFFGDADIYPDTIVAQGIEPSASIDSGDIAALNGLGSPGAPGVFSATHNDAKLATGGAIVWTAINGVLENTSSDGAVGEYGSGTTSFKFWSSDGVTNPISFTRV